MYDRKIKANSKSTEVDRRNIVLGTYRSWESQDTILDLASEGGVINAWDGSEWVPDPEKPGNYKNVSLNESYPLGNLLKSPYFGMTERISQRKLEYASGLPVDINAEEVVEEENAGVPLMSARGWTSGNFDDQEKQMVILDDIRTTYKDYPGFTFEAYGGQLLVTNTGDPNHRYDDSYNDKIYIDMDRKFGGNKAASKELQTFIALHAKTEEK